jgi:CHAD domain-containing protein
VLRASNTEPQRFALEQVRRLLKDLTLQVSRVNHSCTPDSVHDLRIAVRRLVRTITVCKAFFHGKAIRKCRRRLAKIMTAAGAVRDCDVALRYAAKWPTPDTARFESKLQKRRNESARILIDELSRWRDRHMSIRWRAALEVSLAHHHNSSPGTVRELAQRALHRLEKRFEDRGNEASASLASAGDLHRFRIAAKKFRYTLELFHHLDSSLSGKVAKLKPATALLGDINDCVSAAAILDDYQKTDRLINHLEKRRRKKTKAFRKYWKKELAGLETPTIV